MMREKIEILVVVILILSAIILITALERQLKERKNQYICEGYLRHWKTAFDLYKTAMREKKSPFTLAQKEEWMETVFAKYILENEARQCPKVGAISHKHSYKINSQLFHEDSSFFPTASSQAPLVFDANVGKRAFTFHNDPFVEVSYRHSEGANFLFTDGRVFYKREKDARPKSK